MNSLQSKRPFPEATKEAIPCARPRAVSGVTYHAQESTDLISWLDIATYSGSNIVLSGQAAEVSRIGSPDESVTIRDISGMNGKSARYARVNVTRP